MATGSPPKNNMGIVRRCLKKVKLVKYLMYIHNQKSIWLVIHKAEFAKSELIKLPSVIRPSVFYIFTYIVYIVHKVVICEMEQIQDRLKPDLVINFINA